MIHFQIAESLEEQNIPVDEPVEALVQRAAGEALAHTGTDPVAGVTVLLSDDAQLHALNRQYLGIDAPTDVLSFPAGDIDPDSETLYLGDIVISYPRVRTQAEAAGHSAQAELQLLVVHGVLHLLGYDHAEEDEKAEMWALQTQILKRLGLDQIKLPE